MMKITGTWVGLTLGGYLLAACSDGSGEPTVLADGAVRGMWSSREAADVQACIERLVGSQASARYKVTANDGRKTAFATTVSIMPPSTDDAMDRTVTKRSVMTTG